MTSQHPDEPHGSHDTATPPSALTSEQRPIGVRELRNNVAAVVRQAGAGERLIVTVDGRPVAQLGPIQPDTNGVTLWDLAAAGLVSPPRRPDRPPDPDPLPVPADLSADRLLEASRGR